MMRKMLSFCFTEWYAVEDKNNIGDVKIYYLVGEQYWKQNYCEGAIANICAEH